MWNENDYSQLLRIIKKLDLKTELKCLYETIYLKIKIKKEESSQFKHGNNLEVSSQGGP